MSRNGRAQVAAFTLVELLVVIGIIALLISILLPSLARARQSANALACQSNLRSIGQMVVLYANDNRGLTVPAWSDNHFFHYADTLSNMVGQPLLDAPDPNYPAGNENFLVQEVLDVFQDRDVPLDTWSDRATSYMGNVRILGAYGGPQYSVQGVYDPLVGGPGYPQRQLSDIRDSSAAMMMWDSAVEIAPNGVNYGVFITMPQALDNYAMFNKHGLLAPDPAIPAQYADPSYYGNPVALGAELLPGSNPSSAVPGSVTKNYLQQANTDYTAGPGVFAGPGGSAVNNMRFRHKDNDSANFLFADGHVEARTLGSVLAKDVSVNR